MTCKDGSRLLSQEGMDRGDSEGHALFCATRSCNLYEASQSTVKRFHEGAGNKRFLTVSAIRQANAERSSRSLLVIFAAQAAPAIDKGNKQIAAAHLLDLQLGQACTPIMPGNRQHPSRSNRE